MNEGGVRASLGYAKSGPETVDGQVVKAFGSGVTPDSKELHDAIDAALK